MPHEITTQDLEELLAAEGLVPLKDLIPEKADSTRKKWVRSGINGVRLEATLNGRIWVSTKQALARFRARLRGQSIPTPVEDASSFAERGRRAQEEVRRLCGVKTQPK